MSNLYEQQPQIDPNAIEILTQLVATQDFYLGYDVAVLTEQGQQVVREGYGPIPVDVRSIEGTNQFIQWVRAEGLQHCEAQARRIHDSRFMEISPVVYLMSCNQLPPLSE